MRKAVIIGLSALVVLAAVAAGVFATHIHDEMKIVLNSLAALDARMASVETTTSDINSRVQRVESALTASTETPARRFEVRRFMILNHLKQLAAPQPIILGDSIVEGGLLPSTLTNGGTGGFRSLDLLSMVTIAKKRPAWENVNCAVISIGVNDAMKTNGPDQAAKFNQNIGELLSQVERPVVVTTFPRLDGAATVETGEAKAINAIIRSLNVPVFDLKRFMEEQMGEEYASAFIEDKIHLSPEGYAVWRDGIEKAASLCPSS